jgi:hypothetical protein
LSSPHSTSLPTSLAASSRKTTVQVGATVRSSNSGVVCSQHCVSRNLALSSGVFRNYQVSVSLYADEGGIDAVFAVEVIGQLPGIEAELERAGETFAEGVSSYVEQLRGAAVEAGGPSRLSNRSRRGSITRFLKRSQGVLVIAVVPAAAVTYLNSHSGIAAAFAALWVFILLLSVMLIRYRVYGMRAWVFVVCIGMLLLVTIPLTLVVALLPLP